MRFSILLVAVVGLLCGPSWAPVFAGETPPDEQEVEFNYAVAERVVACLQFKTEPDVRLECYDQLAIDLPSLLDGDTTAASPTCEVEDWKLTKRGSKFWVSGAADCKDGMLAFRLYDKETDAFLFADTVFLRGYTFKYPTDLTAINGEVVMKYVIE